MFVDRNLSPGCLVRRQLREEDAEDGWAKCRTSYYWSLALYMQQAPFYMRDDTQYGYAGYMPPPVYYSPYPPPPSMGGPTYVSGPTYQHPECPSPSPAPNSRPAAPLQPTQPTVPPSPPQKRPVGRPRKDGTKPGNAKGGKAAAAKAAKAKADGKKRARRATNAKENEPVSDPIIVDNPQPLTRTTPTPIDISDDDSDSSDNEEESGRKRWSAGEKTLFFDWLLGPDSQAEHRFAQHKKNPAHVYRKASVELFSGKRSDKSVGGMWQRALATFGYIVALESFTGNGGGDPDLDDPAAILGKKLDAARNAGLVVGTLKPSVVELWEKKGWRDLFTQRFGANAKVARPVIRSSAAPLSDVDDDEENVDPVLLAEERKAGGVPKTPAVKNPATVVSETKFTPASKFRTQVNNSLGNMSELVKVKMAAEEKKSRALEAKLELEKEKLDLEKKRMEIDNNKGKVDMARTSLSAGHASTTVTCVDGRDCNAVGPQYYDLPSGEQIISI
ncbi:hypothetical protein R3P38DRAFT_2801014 [Favolaschia claudopus]|uniref:No apical meristem-associated C-terminal domain-containing protein n=1 Tax=Favolaschia claudopus TaxID=2862362 RepID=A0AAV9ZW94_9AGAR